VEVVNNQFLDIRVYAEGNGASHVLGDVPGKSSGRFTIDPRRVSMASGLQIRVDPIGSTRNYLSPLVFPSRGATVVLTVAAELGQSYIFLR
jgi:hypothetical protein